MKRMLLLGDEAIAQGALDAGLSGVYAYPGTPSTEITEYIQRSKEARERGVHSNWSTNEKTAMESALGMSYAGKRAMSCMKHVGLNVAADGFVNAGITGANGGLLVVVADDPSMHSSQNEQDSRFYGKFAMIPVLEPSNQQECYLAAQYGFDLSEKYGTPVMLRITTRLAHSRAGVECADPRPENDLTLPTDKRQFVLLPAIARRNYQSLLGKQAAFEEEAEASPLNSYEDAADTSLGIIACGIAYNYVMENYPEGCPHPVLKIGQYPVPRAMVKRMLESCARVLILEEGAPMIEEQIRGLMDETYSISGRLDGVVPRAGELNPNIVAKALTMEVQPGMPQPELVQPRPPELCKGCPHIDSYNALNEALKELDPGRVFSDIGCYTLGALAPFHSINTCVDMGASITMAKGAADAGLFPAVAVIGDSTFTHSGMTGLLDAIIENTPITVMIVDNETTGMTGGQTSAARGRLEDICKGLGVAEDHILVVEPIRKNHEQNVALIKQELYHRGVSVIIERRECVQTAVVSIKLNKEKAAKEAEA
ncbi:MAG: thiamine pyrophosphate-dependent enzyme [Bacteroidota bacterium]|jgi:indolepyruvate ferredoxin oxidoreductase alpha subunit|nr:thiamine pyrophosphate-dependent enzyme [Bacteroidota bacterium]